MSNPDNAIGTNGAYNGRTSVDAFNDDLSVYSRGILNGWSCVVSSGLTVALGGVNGVRDVAVATDNNGNNTTINNISQSPVQVTISSAPATNSRIDLVVAYVDNPPQGVSTTADNPNACGLIVVKGTANASPVEPDDGAIRTAITADGASGTTAYYVVLAKVTIASGTTDLTNDNITQGSVAQTNGGLITDGSITGSKIDWNTTGTGYAEGGTGDSYFRRIKWVTVWDYYKTSAPATATVDGTYTSPSGNPYEFIVVNHRTGGAITSGAENITHARGGIIYQPTTHRSVQIAIRGITAGQNTYFDCMGGYDIGNSTAITPYRYTATGVSGQPYSSAITVGSSNNQNTISVTWEATRGTTSRWWHIRGTIYGQRVAASFVISAAATTNGTIPGIYIPGTASNLPLMASSWFEISEPQDD